MSEPFLGEIKLFAFGRVPQGWALCNGQLLSIAQNQALFSLLGTAYGGDGRTTFALPNLQGRVAAGVGQGPGLPYMQLGQSAGEATHTLTSNEMPMHNHMVSASANDATQVSPQGNVWAASSTLPYSPVGTVTPMGSGALGQAGGSQPHANMQPYLVLNFCIATTGIYPSRN